MRTRRKDGSKSDRQIAAMPSFSSQLPPLHVARYDSLQQEDFFFQTGFGRFCLDLILLIDTESSACHNQEMDGVSSGIAVVRFARCLSRNFPQRKSGGVSDAHL